MNGPGLTGLRLRSRLDLGKVWPDFLVWLAVSVATLGLGWLVVAGHFFRGVINSVELTDAGGTPVGKLVCDYDVEKGTAALLRWLLICVLTLGVGLLFYSFHAARAAMNHTRVEWY
jgi:membrane protein required for beta-lactamase induction